MRPVKNKTRQEKEPGRREYVQKSKLSVKINSIEAEKSSHGNEKKNLSFNRIERRRGLFFTLKFRLTKQLEKKSQSSQIHCFFEYLNF